MDCRSTKFNQVDETPEFNKPIKRGIKEISNYKQFKVQRQIYQPTKIIQKKYVQMKSKNGQQYPFPVYDDSIFQFPDRMDKLLISRQQDDDNESDDEIVHASVRFNYKCLVEALSKENGKSYTLQQFEPDKVLGFSS